MANMLTVLRGSRSGYDIRNFKKSVRKVFADEITRKKTEKTEKNKSLDYKDYSVTFPDQADR